MAHYIKFQYTRWDRWKRLTREFIKKARQNFHTFWHRIYFMLLIVAGEIGFLGRDPKFFPDGGFIGRMKTRFKRNK